MYVHNLLDLGGGGDADIVADGVLSFCTIALAMKVPRITDKKIQQAAVIGWSGLMFVMYSFLLSIFRIKNGGYPFSLPPFM
jgi:oligosaccharyltransferase complex subunit gamma